MSSNSPRLENNKNVERIFNKVDTMRKGTINLGDWKNYLKQNSNYEISECVLSTISSVEISLPSFMQAYNEELKRREQIITKIRNKILHDTKKLNDMKQRSKTIKVKNVIDTKTGIMANSKLDLTVVEAFNLSKFDMDGQINPIVLVQCENHIKSTSIKKNTVNPLWNENFELPIVTGNEEIFISVFSSENSGEEKFIGEAEVKLSSLEDQKTHLRWYQLRSEDEHIIGYIKIKSHWIYNDSIALKDILNKSIKQLNNVKKQDEKILLKAKKSFTMLKTLKGTELLELWGIIYDKKEFTTRQKSNDNSSSFMRTPDIQSLNKSKFNDGYESEEEGINLEPEFQNIDENINLSAHYLYSFYTPDATPESKIDLPKLLHDLSPFNLSENKSRSISPNQGEFSPDKCNKALSDLSPFNLSRSISPNQGEFSLGKQYNKDGSDRSSNNSPEPEIKPKIEKSNIKIPIKKLPLDPSSNKKSNTPKYKSKNLQLKISPRLKYNKLKEMKKNIMENPHWYRYFCVAMALNKRNAEKY